MCDEYVCILPALCAGFVVNFAGILDECQCFAEMSIHFRFGNFSEKISKGHAEFLAIGVPPEIFRNGNDSTFR